MKIVVLKAEGDVFRCYMLYLAPNPFKFTVIYL